MKSFYEKDREYTELDMQRNIRHEYPAHYHHTLEVFILKKGSYDLLINENRYHCGDDCIAIVDSYDVHAYERKAPVGDDCIVFIPYKYLTRFNARRKGMRIAQPVIRDARLCDALMTIADTYIKRGESECVREAGAELFLAVLGENMQFVEGKGRDEVELVRKLLAYIYEHFHGDVSREVLAKATGYTASYVSRVFHRYLHVGISEYVNGLRLDYVKQMRENGDERTLTDLVYDSGFKSMQTYYRCKAKRKE